MNTCIELIVPIPVPPLGRSGQPTDYKNIVNELLSVNKTIPILPDETTNLHILEQTPLQISLRKRAPKKLSKKWRSRSILSTHYLIFSSHMNVDITDFSQNYKDTELEITTEEVERIAKEVLGDILYFSVCSLLLCSHIAYPGALQASPLFTFADDDLLEQKNGFSWTLYDSVEIAIELGWPEIRRLPIIDVWNWIMKIPGFHIGQGVGRVGRALAALSRIIQNPQLDSPINFVWSLMALEALYASGNEGIKSQLMEKTELFLGQRLANKKRFNRIYDFRSRFVHGDIDFQFEYAPYPYGEPDKFWDDVYDCERIAASILIATLQELILRDMYDLEFEYSIKSISKMP